MKNIRAVKGGSRARALGIMPSPVCYYDLTWVSTIPRWAEAYRFKCPVEGFWGGTDPPPRNSGQETIECHVYQKYIDKSVSTQFNAEIPTKAEQEKVLEAALPSMVNVSCVL